MEKGNNKAGLWSFIFLVISAVSVLSCGTDTADPVLSSLAERVEEITPDYEIPLGNTEMMNPTKIKKYGDFFVIGISNADHAIEIYNAGKGDILKCAFKGRGFGEMLSPSSIQVFGQYIYLFDYQLGNYWRIDLEKSLADGKQEIELVSRINQTRGGEVYIPIYLHKMETGAICTGLLGGHKWYSFLNENYEETSIVQDCDFENFNGLSDISRNNVFLSSHISVSPDGSRVVCALQPAAAISISEIVGTEMKEYYRKTFYSCEVRDTPSGPVFNAQNNKEAFCGVCSDSNYLYLLYSGQSLGKEIPCTESSYVIVLDWNGNPIKSFHLSKRICAMCMEGNTLYGITAYPESAIVFYSVMVEKTQRSSASVD